MATTLSTCLGLKLCRPTAVVSPAGWSEKITAGYSSHAYYPHTSPAVVRQLSSLVVMKECFALIKHKESIVKVKNALMMLVDKPLESMIIVDRLQKLGIDYQFKDEIESMLGSLYQIVSHNDRKVIEDLYHVTLSFRLLRQAGYPISSNVLTKFIDKKGSFKWTLKTDVQGLLSLYEASCMNTGEDVLDKAKEFSKKNLASCVKFLEPSVGRLISHSLKQPCHMTLSRYSVRHYLDCYGVNGGILEELARQDFNLVQALHKKELGDIISWWNNTRLAKELKFARNQPLKWYMWAMTMLHEPQFSMFRIEITKVIAFIYIIDDFFDVYGSPEDLELFINAITIWELSAINTLPSCMQSFYKALHNNTNDIAEAIFKEHGWNPISSLKNSWATLCNAFLVESRWLRSKDIPKADEYLRNAMISSGVYVVMMHAFFLLGQGITKENADFIERNPPFCSCTATILRLWDDLGSDKDENQEGFDGSYVEYYMKEFQCSSEDARYHVKKLISKSWKKLNKECLTRDHFAPNLVSLSVNSCRMVEVMYAYDDNQKLPVLEDYINSLLFKSI